MVLPVPVAGDTGHVAAHDTVAGILNDPATNWPQGNATYATPRAATISSLGDSLESTGGIIGVNDAAWGTDNNNTNNHANAIVMALTTLGWRLRFLRDGGVSGNTVSQINARVATITQDSPTFVVLGGGRNDLNAGTAPAAIMATKTTTAQALISAGCVVVMNTVPPSTDDNTAGKLSNWNTLNQLICDYARTTKGVLLNDQVPYWADPATGTPLSGVTKDGTHDSPDGASRRGYALAQVLAPFVAGSRALVHHNADVRSLGQNPMMTGTSGSVSAGVTGTVADGWTVNVGAGSAVASKVTPRLDSIGGAWQQIALGGAGTTAQLYFTGYTTSLGTLWTPGTTKYLIECEFEADGDWSGVTRFGMQAYIGGQANNCYANMDFSGLYTAGNYVYPRSGVLRSPAGLLTSAATAIGVGVHFEGTAGTVRLGRVTVRSAT